MYCAVAEEGFVSRKMLQQVEFNQQTFQNRWVEFQAIDVEAVFYGNASSRLFQIQNPGQLNGFLAVQMAQQGITVSAFYFPALPSKSTLFLTLIFSGLGNEEYVRRSELHPIAVSAARSNTLWRGSGPCMRYVLRCTDGGK